MLVPTVVERLVLNKKYENCIVGLANVHLELTDSLC